MCPSVCVFVPRRLSKTACHRLRKFWAVTPPIFSMGPWYSLPSLPQPYTPHTHRHTHALPHSVKKLEVWVRRTEPGNGQAVKIHFCAPPIPIYRNQINKLQCVSSFCNTRHTSLVCFTPGDENRRLTHTVSRYALLSGSCFHSRGETHLHTPACQAGHTQQHSTNRVIMLENL